MAKFLTESEDSMEYSMVGYKLNDTLSEFGSVSRGICGEDKNNNLVKIVETLKIIKRGNEIISIENDGSETLLTGNEIASMNNWGFKPSVFEQLEKRFSQFLKTEIDKPKSEMYIPSVVFDLIDDKVATVKVLEANSPWFGVTYKEDKPFVIEKINVLIANNEYPEKLWE
jgi:hypothetical protein